MKHLQISDRQSNFIFYLVHKGKERTEAARLAGFAAPRQSAFTLTQSPKIIAKKNTRNSLKSWWARQDLNLRPDDYESSALTN